MKIEERKKEIEKMGLKRDKSGIIEFDNLEYTISRVKDAPSNYDYGMKVLLVENLFENIKFISGLDKNRIFFEKLGINKNMSLNNHKDVNTLYNFLVSLVNSYNDFAITFAFYNHKSQENYRKEIDKEKERVSDSEKIEDDTLWYFSSQWDVLNSSLSFEE